MSKNREQIIVDNFFKLLEERKISQSEYAKATNIDRTLISKWKNGQSKMTIEHINTAIEYFQISLEDLYYEPKEHINNGNNTSDIKVNVKRKYKINDISYISNFKDNFLFSLTFAITLTIIIILLQSHSIHFIYLIFISLITAFSFSNNDAELPYIIINNEDKVYYKSDIKNNIYYKNLNKLYMINFITISLITILSLIFLFIYKGQKAIIITHFIVSIIMLIILTLSKPLKSYPNVKSIELSNYMNIRMYFVLSLCNTSLICILLCYDLLMLPVFIINVAITIISIFVFYYESKNYSSYYLVLKEKGKEERRIN